MKSLTLEELSKLVDGQVTGDSQRIIHGLSGLERAKSTDLSFYSNPKYKKQLFDTQAGSVLVPLDFNEEVSFSLIKVKNPYLSFIQLLSQYQRFDALKKVGREQPNFIGEEVIIQENCYIGAFAYIGAHSKISEGVKIYPQVYIGEHVEIGKNTVIFPGTRIYPGTIIGAYCTIHAGAVIGSAGFGYLPNNEGMKPIAQIGNVILKDHVDVGANTTIDCATVDSTIIHKGTKIDNLVHIAHNVEVGDHSVIAAQTGISGSTKIGSRVTFAGQVGVAGHIEVADGVKAGGKAGITKSIKEKDAVVSGPYAFDHEANKRAYSLYKMLPTTMKRIQALEEKLLNLEGRS